MGPFNAAFPHMTRCACRVFMPKPHTQRIVAFSTWQTGVVHHSRLAPPSQTALDPAGHRVSEAIRSRFAPPPQARARSGGA